MSNGIEGYDDWKLRSDIDQEELDRMWARRGKRERDPDRDDRYEEQLEAEERDE